MKTKIKPLFVELDSTLKDQLMSLAKRNKRTLKGQVVLILEAALAADKGEKR